jgi:hypothetical protein
VMKSPDADDRGLRALEGRGTNLVPVPSGPAPRQGALVGIAPPRWFHHRLISAVPSGTDAAGVICNLLCLRNVQTPGTGSDSPSAQISGGFETGSIDPSSWSLDILDVFD